MIQVRKSGERGQGEHGWLHSKHTFSFAEYHDANFMGFHTLRVINEDKITGGSGFPPHPHRDMEIISYVISGALEHQDSEGNKAVIRPGEVQRMSAGAGITHSEYNKLSDQEAHFLQIWIIPNARGGKPGYGQKSFLDELNKNELILTASQDGRNGSISIKQDADMYVARLSTDKEFNYSLRHGRGLWLQMITGELQINGHALSAGDGAAVENEPNVQLNAKSGSEFIVFDLESIRKLVAPATPDWQRS